jgi:dipeptidyl aminopeptidase/acylaminoacyl peptidase
LLQRAKPARAWCEGLWAEGRHPTPDTRHPTVYHAAMKATRNPLINLRSAILIILLIAAAPVLADEKQPIVTSDLLRIRTVSSIDVAQNGSKAVFAVRSIADRNSRNDNDHKRYRYQSHLFLLDLTNRNARPQQITFGKRNDRSPVLSPNGRFIAFVRSDEADDDNSSSQIWLLSTDGGEARQLTHMKHGASSPQFSPDSRTLLFQSNLPMDEIDGTSPWPMERPQRTWNDAQLGGEGANENQRPRPDGTREEIRAWLHQNAVEQNPHVITRISFQDEQRLKRPMRFQHLFTLDLRDESQNRTRSQAASSITPTPASHPTAARSSTSPHKPTTCAPFTPTASKRTKSGSPASTARTIARSFTCPAGASARPAPATMAASSPSSAARTMNPHSANGRSASRRSKRPCDLEVDADEPIWLTDEDIFDHSVRSIAWEPARMSLYFTASVKGGIPLMTISPGLIKPAPVIENDNGMTLGIQQFATGGGAVVYSQTTPANPNVLRVRDAHGDRLAMDLNDWVHSRSLSIPRDGWITRPDGTRVHYWLMEPDQPRARQADSTHSCCKSTAARPRCGGPAKCPCGTSSNSSPVGATAWCMPTRAAPADTAIASNARTSRTGAQDPQAMCWLRRSGAARRLGRSRSPGHHRRQLRGLSHRMDHRARSPLQGRRRPARRVSPADVLRRGQRLATARQRDGRLPL